MKTAMQEVFEKFDLFPLTEDGDADFLKYLKNNREQLLLKERQQILDSYGKGWYDEASGLVFTQAEKYYNETYGSDDKE